MIRASFAAIVKERALSTLSYVVSQAPDTHNMSYPDSLAASPVVLDGTCYRKAILTIVYKPPKLLCPLPR